jgi:hypothetical protein
MEKGFDKKVTDKKVSNARVPSAKMPIAKMPSTKIVKGGNLEKKNQKLIKEKKKVKASHRFVMALALVSIAGFIGIVSYTLFDFDMRLYVEAAWLLILGLGLIAEGQVKRIGSIREQGLTPTNFTHLITIIVGVIAVLAGIFSIPLIRVETAGFLAVKGIISVIAIIIIAVQTWVVE